jgi:hypothetical protein
LPASTYALNTKRKRKKRQREKQKKAGDLCGFDSYRDTITR